MNAVTYSRCNIENKPTDMSICDQEAMCKAKAEISRFTLVDQFRDKCVPGYIRFHDRCGGVELLSAAFDNKFDVLVTESLDRIEGDSELQVATVRHLEEMGVRIIGVTDGYDSEKFWSSMLLDIREVILDKHLNDAMKRIHYAEDRAKMGIKQRTISWFTHMTFIASQLIKILWKKRKQN